MNGADVLVSVEDVSKKFCRDLRSSLKYGLQDVATELFRIERKQDLRPKEFWAVSGVGFELKRGECLGLIGRNGAGKTTLLKMLNGLVKPDRGRIEMRGRTGALIALGAGFNPVLTGRENIHVNASVLGLSRAEIDRRMDDIIEFAELRDFIDTPVQSYSSGMSVRLGFAVASTLDPDVLILDEVLAVGDAAFRAKCYKRIGEIRKRAAVIFVSHNMEQVARICDTALVMSKGTVAYLGPVDEGIQTYERINEEGGERESSFLRMNEPVTAFGIQGVPDEIRSGEGVRLQFEITCDRPMRKATLRVIMHNRSGSCSADCNFRTEDHGVEIFAGLNRWDVQIASIPLRSGRYHVSFGILDEHGDISVWSYKTHQLLVVGAHPAAQGELQLPLGRWSAN